VANALRIPAFVNPESGTSEGARGALERTGLFDIYEVPPQQLRDRLIEAIEQKPARILIAGGDGTIRTAVEAVAATGVELAVLPSGTLNHFAKDHGIPIDLDEAARNATDGTVISADVGRVGEHLFHGTSSIGAYVIFMQVRERLEPTFGYRISSFLALIWTFFRMPTIAVGVEIDGKQQIYRTPILFVAVGERELQVPTLGGRVPGGKRGLHVMVVHGRRRARFFLLALDAFANGIREASRSPELDAFLVESCSITMRRKRVRISFDGEAQYTTAPLEYRLERDILRVVVSDTSKDGVAPSGT